MTTTGPWPTYVDEDDVERCMKCNHACGLHEQICLGQNRGWTQCTCGRTGLCLCGCCDSSACVCYDAY